MPGARAGVGQVAGGGEHQRFEDGIACGAQIGAVGGQDHLEGLGSRGGRRGDAQAIGRSGVFGGFEVDFVGLAVQAGGEIEDGVSRRSALLEQQVRISRRVVREDEREVGRAGTDSEGEVAALTGRIRADKSLGLRLADSEGSNGQGKR